MFIVFVGEYLVILMTFCCTVCRYAHRRRNKSHQNKDAEKKKTLNIIFCRLLLRLQSLSSCVDPVHLGNSHRRIEDVRNWTVMAHIHIGKGEYTRRTYTHTYSLSSLLFRYLMVKIINYTQLSFCNPGGLFYIHYCFVLQKKKDLLLFIFFILEFLVCCPVCVCVF